MFEEGMNDDISRIPNTKRFGALQAAEALDISGDADFEETSIVGSDDDKVDEEFENQLLKFQARLDVGGASAAVRRVH